jgi:hypothetical protein
MSTNYDAIEQVALVTGKILQEGTGKPVRGNVRIAMQEGEIFDKVLEDGTFVISGEPKLLFPELSSKPYTLNLKVRADSPQFLKGFAEKTLPPQTVPQSYTFDRPILLTTIVLLPADLVNLGGYVFNANATDTDPNKRIGNAKVEVLHEGMTIPPVFTSNNPSDRGRYRFKNIQVKAPAKIQCSATNFKTETRDLFIDFTKSLNEEYFRLVPL